MLRVIDDLAGDPAVNGRWLSVGRTHIEQGFMAVNRAVFQPGRVALVDEIECSEGICGIGASILKNGVPMSVSDILKALSQRV